MQNESNDQSEKKNIIQIELVQFNPEGATIVGTPGGTRNDFGADNDSHHD